MFSLKFEKITSAVSKAEEIWQAVLWVEADFSVHVSEGVLLNEPHWCVLELALSLKKWLKTATESGPDFVYTSMSAEQQGLLWFKCVENNKWLVGSAWQSLENQSPCDFYSLSFECERFIKQVIIESKKFINTQTEIEILKLNA